MKPHLTRLKRERRTITEMILMYCRTHHSCPTGLCAECDPLLAYALQRIDKCPYQVDKPTCAKCPIHCYQPEMRQSIRVVMRYSGPRMLFRHPLLAILHLLDGMTSSHKNKK
ncbi:MAG: nitrous oxide-stimulated promoter family protein [Anaerolinea sp.]|nr:nitrous oxide-stimulated promoter family protein [Anaerolinea sp.]